MKKVILFLIVVLLTFTSEVFANTYTVSSTADNGAGTLRQAIINANSNGGGPHLINFSVAGTITLNSELPAINNGGNANGLVIDATTAPGYNGKPVVLLSGNYQNGLNIDNVSNVQIKGLAFQNFTTGIRVNNGQNTTISKNFIGTNLNGDAIVGIKNRGIYLTGAANSTISNNVISGTMTVPEVNGFGNVMGAIHVGSNSNGVKISGNLIGTNFNGSAYLGNGGLLPNNQLPFKMHGIYIESSNLTINQNVISGSVGNGILANNISNLKIWGNHIGTDSLGQKAIPNKAAGIRIDGGSGHLIGGSTLSEKNVISGNGGAIDSRPCGAVSCEPWKDVCPFDGNDPNNPPCPTKYDGTLQVGIYLSGVSTSKISGNFIGTNEFGTAAIGNFYAGIKLENGSSGITIGGQTAAEGNVVGGNGFGINPLDNKEYRGHGIQLSRQNSNVHDITIYNNRVGVGPNFEAIGNRQDGISLLGSYNNVIGTTDWPNYIGNNSWGIFLQSDFNGGQSRTNTISGNYIGTDGTNTFGNGVRALDDEGGGIGIQHGSNTNTIQANKVSANRDGIAFRGSGNGAPVTTNSVYGNTITDNKNNGIILTEGATSNNIGAVGTNQGNTISNNGQDGIHMENGVANKVFNNIIDKNGGDGIELKQSATGGSESNIIGGVTDPQKNTISNNGGNGVIVSGSTSTKNSIHKNSFSCNALRGIELEPGANNDFLAPVLKGTLIAPIFEGPANSYIEIYELDNCNTCASGDGKLQGAKLFLTGNSPLAFTPTTGRTYKDYVALAHAGNTTTAHNTSEFSVCKVLCTTPTPSIIGALAQCASSKSVTFSTTNNAGSSYLWSATGGVTIVGAASGNSVTVDIGTIAGTLSIKETNAGGCDTTITRTITINELPKVVVNPSSTEICLGKSATLNTTVTGGTLPINYTWTASVGTVPTGANPTVSPTETTNYTVSVKDGNNCVSAATGNATITVNKLPKVTISVPDAEICVGESVVLTTTVTDATGTPNFTWTANPGPVPTGENPSVSPTETTDYTVSVTDGKGCTSSTLGSVQIKVNQNPTVTITPTNGVICLGQSSTLTTVTNATGTIKYTWTANPLPAPSGANPVVTPNATTDYTVIVEDGNGCKSQNAGTAKVTVNGLPEVKVVPSKAEICLGESADLVTTVTGATGTVVYTWTANPAPIPSGASPTVSPTVTTDYTVLVEDGNGCKSANTGTAKVIVNKLPIIAVAPTSPAICLGESTTLTTTVTDGKAPIKYTWTANPGPAPSGESPVVSPTDTTEYTVTIEDANGCASAASASTTVIVNPLPVVSINPTNAKICLGETTTLNTTVTGATGIVKYVWTGVPTPSPIPTGANPEVSPTATTDYSVTITDGNNCSSATPGTTNVVVNKLPVISVVPVKQEICFGDSTTLTTTVIDATGVITYTWTANPAPIPVGESPIVKPGSTTDYTVSVKDENGCTSKNSASTKVVVNTLPILTLTPDATEICKGSSAILKTVVTGGNGSVSYHWTATPGPNPSGESPTVSPADTTIYTLIVTDTKGCSADTQSVQIDVNENPVLVISTTVNDTICKGTSAILSTNITKGNKPYVSIVWTASQSPVPNQDDFNPSVSPVVTTDYAATVTDSKNCKATDGIKIAVIDVPEGPLSTSNDSLICSSATDNIVLRATGETAKAKLVWYKTSCGVDSVGTGPNFEFAHPEKTITYFVSLKNICGNSICKPVTVKVNRDPKDDLLSVSPQDTSICTVYNGNIDFKIDSVYNPDARVAWYMKGCGDSLISYNNNPFVLTRMPKVSTSYYVRLEVEACPSSACDSSRINIIDPQVFADNQKFCKNADFNTIVAGIEPPTVKWRWEPKDPSYTLLFDTTKLISTVNVKKPAEKQIWYLIADNEICPPVIDTISIVVHDLPVVTLDIPQDTLCSKVEFDAVATVVKGVPNAYVWLTPNSSIPDTSWVLKNHEITLSKKFTAEVIGRNYFLVTVVDTNNCWAELPAIDSVEIFDRQELVIPNLMTPNHDDKNETYVIRDVNNFDILPGAKLEVYNRWGERVYRSSNYDNSWNATNINDGMYYYYLKTGCANDEYKGWLHIISNNNRHE